LGAKYNSAHPSFVSTTEGKQVAGLNDTK